MYGRKTLWTDSEERRRTNILKNSSTYKDSFAIFWIRSIFSFQVKNLTFSHRLQKHITKSWPVLESSSRTVVSFIHQVAGASKPDNRKIFCSLFLSAQLLALFRDQMPWRQNQRRNLTCSGPKEIKSANLHQLFLRKVIESLKQWFLFLGNK